MKVNGVGFRQQMLELAAETAGKDEPPQDVIRRAETYARWVLPQTASSTVISPFYNPWLMTEIDIGPDCDRDERKPEDEQIDRRLS